MVAWDRVTHDEVVRAIKEYDRLGPERFFAEHGFVPTTTYELVWEERHYPPKTLGWQAMIFDGKANPKTQASAMMDALAWGATFILASSVDYRSIQLPLHETKKAGVPVASVGQGGDTPNALPVLAPGQLAWAFAVDPDNYALGRSIGEWIIKDSGGKANVVAFNDKEFDGVVTQHAGIMDALHKCPGCKVDEQSFSANQIATNLGQQVVGYLRAHPDVDYVYMPYDRVA